MSRWRIHQQQQQEEEEEEEEEQQPALPHALPVALQHM
jgi:hypothetical protein